MYKKSYLVWDFLFFGRYLIFPKLGRALRVTW